MNHNEAARKLNGEWRSLLEAGDFEEAEQLLNAAPTEVRNLAEKLSLDYGLREGPAMSAGSDFHGFRLIEELGRGSYAFVWKAISNSSGRVSAIKVLRLRHAHSEVGVSRFQAEARAQGKVDHPNVRAIWGYRDVGFIQITENELIDPSQTLENWIHQRLGQASGEGGLRDYERTVAEIFRKIAGGLTAAHAVAVIHRDVKPANILIDSQDEPHLIDFGVARLPTPAALTRGGELVGTRTYMSPESLLVDKHGLNGRADVYSLGICLYEALVGRPPFEANTDAELTALHLWDTPVDPRQARRSVNKSLARIALYATQPNANDRYPSMAQMEADLAAFLRGEPISAVDSRLRDGASRFTRRHPRSVPIVTASLGMLAALVLSQQIKESWAGGPEIPSIPSNPGPMDADRALTIPGEPCAGFPARAEDRRTARDSAARALRTSHAGRAIADQLDQLVGSPDGQLVAGRTDDAMIQVVRVSDLVDVFAYTLEAGILESLRWSDDSSALFVTQRPQGRRQTIERFRVGLPPVLAQLPERNFALRSRGGLIAASNHGRFVIVDSDNSLTLGRFDARDTQLSLTGLASPITELYADWSSDEVYATNSGGDTMRWKIPPAPARLMFAELQGPGRALETSSSLPDPALLAGDQFGLVTKFSAATGRTSETRAALSGGVLDLGLAAGDRFVAATGPAGTQGELCIWNVDDLSLSTPGPLSIPWPTQVSGSPKHPLFVVVPRQPTSGNREYLNLIELDDLTQSWAVVPSHLSPDRAGFTADGLSLVCATGVALEVVETQGLRDSSNPAPALRLIPSSDVVDSPCSALDVSFDGQLVLTGHADGRIHCWSLGDQALLYTLEPSVDRIEDIEFLANDHSFVWLDRSSAAGIHRVGDGEELEAVTPGRTIKNFAFQEELGRVFVLEGTGAISTIEGDDPAAIALANSLDSDAPLTHYVRHLRDTVFFVDEALTQLEQDPRWADNIRTKEAARTLLLNLGDVPLREINRRAYELSLGRAGAGSRNATDAELRFARSAMTRVLGRELNPYSRPEWTHTLGLLQLHLSEWGPARGSLERARELSFEVGYATLKPHFLACLAVAHARTGSPEKAASYWSQLEAGDLVDGEPETLVPWARSVLGW